MIDNKMTGFATSPQEFSVDRFFEPVTAVLNRQVIELLHSIRRHENSRFTGSFGFEPAGIHHACASDPKRDNIYFWREAKLFHHSPVIQRLGIVGHKSEEESRGMLKFKRPFLPVRAAADTGEGGAKGDEFVSNRSKIGYTVLRNG